MTAHTASGRPERRSGPQVLAALVAVLVGAGLGFLVVWLVLPSAGSADEAAPGPASDAAHVCSVVDQLPEPLDLMSLGGIDDDPVHARLGIIVQLASAASVADPTYDELEEHGTDLVSAQQFLDQQAADDAVSGLRTECDALGLSPQDD
ncbi:hypothetical protein [Georgenia sp. Z1491]|uniref:hypothetical protein n=1 Tax=Georgenia sp. Z1491 TaxID=3416707 RepID=UPI003CFBAE32